MQFVRNDFRHIVKEPRSWVLANLLASTEVIGVGLCSVAYFLFPLHKLFVIFKTNGSISWHSCVKVLLSYGVVHPLEIGLSRIWQTLVCYNKHCSDFLADLFSYDLNLLYFQQFRRVFSTSTVERCSWEIVVSTRSHHYSFNNTPMGYSFRMSYKISFSSTIIYWNCSSCVVKVQRPITVSIGVRQRPMGASMMDIIWRSSTNRLEPSRYRNA